MVMHKYKITWKRKEDVKDIKFTTTFMKDFPSSIDEVQRSLDVARLVSELSRYKGLTIIKIEEME
jgi:hypothetical protein